MKRALIIAITIHFGLLLAAGYIYVMRPEKKEAAFRAFLRAEKVAPMKKIRTAPPKKELKKTPAIRPLRRERPIELIAVKRAITSAFTVKLPEVSGAAYSPQIALVSVPEPTLAPERLPSFWEREIELKGRAIQLESFGVTTLKPLGSAENPITRIIIQITAIDCGYSNILGIYYPEQNELVTGLVGNTTLSITLNLGPYAVPPEDIIFYLTSPNIGYCMLLSTDPAQCRRRRVDLNTYVYGWEDAPYGDPGRLPQDDYDDVIMTITFIGAEGW